MTSLRTQTIFHSFLYGGASALLAFDLFLLVRAVFSGNFVPIVPVLAGILLAGGLLFVLYAEQKIREEEKREHRRLSRVAGQLEAPLKTLQNDLESLRKQSESLPADVRMNVKRMETKSKILLENVRDVFLMLRAQEGKISQDARTYNGCTLLKDAVHQIQPLARANNTEVTYKAHCQDAPLKVDKHLFLIALTHVLENAVLYSQRPGLVNIAITKGQRYLRIVIQDRGLGVKAKDREAIFQPFARGDKANQYDSDGIGVGLTLSQLIVFEFGGTLTHKNREDSTGSHVEIKLPLARK